MMRRPTNRFTKIVQMKVPNSTDRFFKEQLGDYDSGAPMHLWDAIDQQRSTEHRVWSRVKRNSWLLMFLLSCTGLGIWGLSAHQQLDLGAFKIEMQAEQQLSNLLQKNQTTQEISRVTLSEEKSNLNSEAVNNQVSGTKESTRHQFSNNQNNSALKENIFKTPVETSEVTHNSRFVAKTTIDQTTVNENLLVTNNSKVTNSLSSPLEEQPQETTKNSNSTDPVALSSDLMERQNSVAALSNLANLNLNSLDVADDWNLPDPCFKFNKKDQKQRKIKKRWGAPKLFVDAVISPDYANRTLALKTNDQTNYLQARSDSERFRYAYSAGLRASLVSRSGIALRTGLMYAQINERFDYENGTATDMVIEEIIDNGQLLGYDTTIVTGTRIKTTFNRFHLIDIPVILGYELEFRRWIFSVNGGAYFNLLFKKKGEILNQNLLPQRFDANNGNTFQPFRKSVGMSYFGSFGLYYKAKENLQFVVEPHFRYYPTSFTNEGYDLKQNYWSAGVMMGVRYRIGN